MNAVERVLEATVTGMGYDLVDVEFGQGGFLRVFIDHPVERNATITLDDCERVTRQLQHVLPVEGIEYDRLEISSPGLDRVLKKPADFRRFAGERAEVKLRIPLEGRRKFTGIVQGANEQEVELEVDGQAHRFPFANLDKARLAPEPPKKPAPSKRRR